MLRLRARRPETLQARLALTLGFVVLLATATVTGLAYVRGREAVLADARAELASSATLLADRLDRAIRERVRLAALWPRLSTSQDLAVDDVDKRVALSLAELATHVGGGAVALAIDTTGRIVAASTPEWMGRVARDERWFRPPPAARAEASTFSLSASVPLLAVAAPVYSAGDFTLLGTIVLLSPWSSMMATRGNPAEPLLALRDREGRFLLRSPGFAGRDTLGLLIAHAPAAASAVPGLEVTVAIPRSTALIPLHSTTRNLLLLAALVLAVSLPGAVLLSRSTTAELRRLTRRAREAERSGRADFGSAGTDAPIEVRVLAGALQAMVERLEASQRELAQQESLAAMGAMAAGLAHEVRTPLSVIRASAEMLSRRMAAGSREGELASFVLEESDRLSRLVDDLLAYARPREPVAQPTDLASIADRAVRAQEIGGEAGKLEARLESAPVSADPEQLYQVALNLLSNALQASPARAPVTIRTWRHGEDAMLEILDRGSGIPPEDLDRIWIPFFSRRAGGTGLGLPIVRRIVEAHRGSVTLEPGPEGGTRARVRLPARRTEEDM